MVFRSNGNEDARAASIKDTLLEMARPDLYRCNDFRVMNLLTCATEREVQKHLRKMQLEQKFGGAEAGVKQSAASSPLPLDPPPDAGMIAEAQANLADAERRLISELFWFWPDGRAGSAWDDYAGAGAPRNAEEKPPPVLNDLETAESFWASQLERGGERQEIAAHNLAVLFHAAALDIECDAAHNPLTSDEQQQRLARYWSKAVEMWKRVLAGENAWGYLAARVAELNDPRVKASTVRRLRESLPVALLTINADLAVRASQAGARTDSKRQAELMRAFDFPREQTNEARQFVLAPVRRRIHDLCVTMGEDARKTPEQAVQVAERLLERARPLLMAVDDLLPSGDPQRPDVLDAVALAANDAAIVRFQSLSHGVKRDWNSAQDFLERISRYAATQSMRAHINKSLIWVRDNIRYSNYKSCWFCGENEDDPASSLTVTMYKMVAANHYNYNDIHVPRCYRCRQGHQRQTALTVAGAVVGAAVFVTGYLFLWRPYGPDVEGGLVFFAALALFAAFAAFGGVMGYRLAAKKSPGTMKPLDHKWSFPDVVELRSKHWTHIKPT
jgi:hypothetical protein